MIGFTVKHKTSNLSKLIDRLPQAAEDGLKKALEETRDAAILVCPVDTGATRDSIQYEIIEVSTATVAGRVFSASEISVYLNFGTGLYAEGEGGSRAKKIPWYIHESMVDVDLAAKYHMGVYISPDDERFYVCYGMRATHFFDNTAFNRRDANVEAVRQSLQEMIRGL